MQRRVFITGLGASAAAICAACLAGCIKTGMDPLPNSGQHSQGQGSNTNNNAIFTLDLNADLLNIWDMIQKNNIFVIRVAAGNLASSFIAVSGICTHQGCLVIFDSSVQEFYCPCHGSIFSLGGQVLQGPAPVGLLRYTVTISQTTLVIT